VVLFKIIKMIKSSTLFFLFFFSSQSIIICQNNSICAYKSLQVAEFFAAKNQQKEAFDAYQKAFINYNAADESYISAAKNAYLLNKTKQTNIFLIKAIEKGATLETIAEDSLLNVYLSSEKSESIRKNYSKLRKIYTSKLDITVYAELKKLLDIDQLIRTGGSEEWGFSALSQKDQRLVFMKIDSGYIVDRFLAILKKKVPTAEEIGILKKDIFIFFLHQMDKVNYEKLYPYIEKCLQNGILSYTHKAMILDRYELITKGYTIYGTRTVIDDNDVLTLQPVKDIKTIDTKRLELGILPLSFYYNTYMPEAQLPKEYTNQMTINQFVNCNN
jgi:hypothetical protein